MRFWLSVRFCARCGCRGGSGDRPRPRPSGAPSCPPSCPPSWEPCRVCCWPGIPISTLKYYYLINIWKINFMYYNPYQIIHKFKSFWVFFHYCVAFIKQVFVRILFFYLPPFLYLQDFMIDIKNDDNKILNAYYFEFIFNYFY